MTIDKEEIRDFLLRFNLSDCLKCSENKDNKNPKIEIKKLEEWCFYQTVRFAEIKK